MEIWGNVIAAIDAVARETMLFAAIGFLVGGLDDLLVDGVFLWIYVRRRLGYPGPIGGMLADHPRRDTARRIAVFVAAWDEAGVIGPMLRTALARCEHDDYRIYVGTYPNDQPTIDAVADVARDDPRIRLVIGREAGPTTKAACLNTIWRALAADEAEDGSHAAAIVIHDAEDVVHPAELRVFDALIGRYTVVQLPVLPLIHPQARLVSGHYADEFATAHCHHLVVRQTLGAGLPLAGVGCAVARDALETVAARRDGAPFDATSLTEDYELGLMLARIGGGVIARIRERPGGPLVAVRAYFPATIAAAVRQKARWMIGIALVGWDRIGWTHAADWQEHWMRMRDRRAPAAMLVLAVAWLAGIGLAASVAIHLLAGTPAPRIGYPTALLLRVNAALLAWRLLSRVAFTAREYGWREAAWAIPRALVGNVIALLATGRAVAGYIAMLRGAEMRWDKTDHIFPDDPVAGR